MRNTNDPNRTWLLFRQSIFAGIVVLGLLTAGGALASSEITYEYNELGRLIRVFDPAGADIQYEYDPAGNVTRREVIVNDTDGDTVADAVDCAPNDSGTWRLPTETRNLRFSIAGDKQSFSWDPPVDFGASGTLLYDTLRAEAVDDLMSADCLESGQADLSATDTATPGAGAVYYYLSRARNDCGKGSLGTGEGGQVRTGPDCPSS